MNYSFSIHNLLILLITAGLFLFVAFVLRHASQAPGGNKGQGALRFSFVYLGVTALLSVAALVGFFDEFNSMPPRPMVIMLTIVATSIFLVTRKLDGALSFLKTVPLHWLLYIQGFRIVVEFVLLGLHYEGIVPSHLTFEGQNFDIVIGALALVVGYLAQKKPGNWKTAGIVFNILGLVSLVNIAIIAVLSMPTSFRVFDMVFLPLYFPGILVPVLFVGFAVYTHILSLKQFLALNKKDS
jgi:hypothetical protein